MLGVLAFVLAAVAVTVVLHLVADRTGIPAAALLTLAGLAYALLPGPNVELDPDLVLTFVLPPLLYSAALDSSLLAIRPQPAHRRQPLGAARARHRAAGRHRLPCSSPGATLAAGIALGAAVAPPDPVAALVRRPPGRAAAALSPSSRARACSTTRPR